MIIINRIYPAKVLIYIYNRSTGTYTVQYIYIYKQRITLIEEEDNTTYLDSGQLDIIKFITITREAITTVTPTFAFSR